ncbi:Lovastatin nonaketide synthase 2 [Colletotrichum sojae]|uniref:Lovastatin nonaketide synthase 2 n=1 Tax=Colletotrichum sojae TaxID=2175907 RepID=A0A8H6IR16_9PEZI|nr:Lovastatin nonaketide synthase 2 [Colletotrichum sojae]
MTLKPSTGSSTPNGGSSDPIAIVGMAIRLPGGVRNTQDFWNLMVEKRSGLIPIPKERWNSDGFYSPIAKWGTVQNKEAYMFKQEDIDFTKFDASFFTCGQQEIQRMDPVQRQLLEITRECLDSAGETRTRGRDIGCYVGNFGSDWQDDHCMDPHVSGVYRGAGYLDFLQPNRVSYEYGWTGPSMLIKTGCSSSMVALHLAAEAVQSGACESAIAMGCNLITSVTTSIVFTETGVLSPSGKCKTFDVLADGYGRGEAVNAVYVKRLSDALRDGNPIRAIIRASGTNNDGRSNGIMSPNTYLQEELIRKTYEKAGVPFSKTAFFECHGTGTPTGDPLEVAAVARVWGEHGGVMIGAVKPNVGHSEGAAGLTSVIKAVLALENRVIPPNIYVNNLNPKIPWATANLSVPREPTPIPADKDDRISVNSFGVAGSNAHVILETYETWTQGSRPQSPMSSDSGVSVNQPGERLLLFSASHMDSLEKQIQQHKEYLAEKPSDLDNVAYTLGHHRDHLGCRAYAIADGQGAFEPSAPKRLSNSPRRTIFVFTGQGVHWAGMGKALLETNDVFRSSIQKLDKFLQSLPSPYAPSWTVEAELMIDDETSRVGKRGYSHPCATAVQIALVDVLTSLNIKPEAVIGHSGGEAAAAYASGSISAEASMAVAYFRGWILINGQGVPPGTMAAVGLGPKEVEPFLMPGVVVGCENSQLNTTLSGDPVCIQHCIDQINRRHPDVKTKVLNLETSFHSPWIAPLGIPYRDLLEPYLSNSKAPNVPHFSSVTGKELTGNEFGPEFWRQNFVQPVLFNTAMRTLLESNPNNLLIEVGPHPALKRPINEILSSVPDAGCEYITTLKMGEDTNLSLLRLAGELFLQNQPVELSSVIHKAQALPDLPSYPWHHDVSYIDEPRNSARYKQRKYTRHVLLGARVLEGNDIEPAWRNMLELKEVPWLEDHIVNGEIVFPAAGYMAIAGEAIRQTSNGAEAFTIREMTISTALTIPKDRKVELYTRLIPEDKKREDGQYYNFKIMSSDGQHWLSHCSGFIRSGAEESETSVTSAQAEQELPRHIEADGWYKAVRTIGIDWQTAFQGLDYITAGTVTREATATVYDFDDSTPYAAHPTLLDQMLQINLIAMTNGLRRRLGGIFLPTFIEKLGVLGKQDLQMRVYGRVEETEAGLNARTAMFTDEGRPTVFMEGMSFAELPTPKQKEPLLGSHFEWDRDITLADSIDEATPAKDSEELATPQLQQLRDTIALLGFKSPDSRILEIGDGATDVAGTALNALRPSPDARFYSKYTYASTSEDALEQVGTDLSTFEDGDVAVVSVEEISLSGPFDIVVLPEHILMSDDYVIEDELEELKNLQPASGRLVVYGLDQGAEPLSDEKLSYQLQRYGYKVHSRSKNGVVLAEPARQVSLDSKTNFTVMTRNSSNGVSWGEGVKKTFKENGFDVSLSHDISVPSSDNAIVISLLDLEGPSVFDLTEETFRPFMDGLCNFAGFLIWVIPSAHKDCQDPRTAMIQGVARTVRMEHGTDITLVEIDEASLASGDFSKPLWKICQSLPNRRKGDDLDADHDFAILDGKVHIPRMSWWGFSDPIVDNAIPASATAPVFREDAAYLLVGGMGGLGRSVATWMIEHGARDLVFLSRSAASNQYDDFVSELESYPGATITRVSGDVSKQEDVIAAIRQSPKPVAGVLQLSLVLRDNKTSEMTFDEWNAVIKPRVQGTWNLHQALLDAQVPLDFFLIFGSGGGHTGYYGQANYSASNTYLDAFVEYRNKQGLPASIVDIGVVGDMGYVLDQDHLLDSFRAGGFYFLKEQDVLNAVAVGVKHSAGGKLRSFCLGGLSTKPLSDPTNRVNWRKDIRFAVSHHFHRSAEASGAGSEEGGDDAATFVELARSDPEALKDPATVTRMAHYIMGALSSLLLRPIEDFSVRENLTSIGLDSIISIELTDWIHQRFHIGLSSMEITQCSSLLHLAEKVLDEISRAT